MRKEAKYGKEARESIFSGVQKIARAVKVTLGPMGRNVLISQSVYTDNYVTQQLPLHSTKDGFTTAKNFELDDPHEKAGVLLVKEASSKTVDQAGDGTTTTVVLLEAIAKEAMHLINTGANPMELKREIDTMVDWVVSELKNRSIQIDNNERIFNIATISANNDAEIGKLIADAFAKIGKEGIIDIEASKNVNTEIKIAEGYRFGKSWIKPIFINNKEKMLVEYDNPLILLYEKTITHHTQVERALGIALQHRRPLLIICEDAKEEGLGFLALNNFERRVQCCVVQAPNYGEQRRQEMEDIALITGGTFISDSKGVGVKEIEFENLGQARRVVINKDETVIIDGFYNKEELETQLNELRMNLAQAKNEDEAFPIEGRIAKLQGGVAVIQVGAPTETEMKEKLDRFDDAVRATKAAIAEGYVPGAGSTFHSIAKSATFATASQGGKVILLALLAPFTQICSNAGVDSELFFEHQTDLDKQLYNAKTGKMEDTAGTKIIDPTKVLRCALQNAASAASTLITTECLIADMP